MTFEFRKLADADLAKLDAWLQKVLWECQFPEADSQTIKTSKVQFEVHRLKGLIVLTSGATKMIQGVREIFEITDAKKRQDVSQAASDCSKLVLIGKGVSSLPWKESLASFLDL